ncbi:MAG: O-antigen ligase family protein [Pseudomonadota bacterium]
MAARGMRNAGEYADRQSPRLLRAGLVVLALLLFIYPIPHTISLRYLLLLAAAVVFGYLAIRRGSPALLLRPVLPLALFGALLAWLFLGAVFISHDPARTLSEVSSQWLMALLSLMAGVAAGSAFANDAAAGRRLLRVVFFVLLAHVVIVDAQALWLAVSSGSFAARAQGLTAGPDQASYLTNMLLALLLGESLVRINGKPSGLGLGNNLLLVAWLIGVVSLYAEGTRNSIPVLVVLCGVIVLFYLVQGRNPKRWLYAGAATALLAVLVVSFAVTTAGVQRGSDWRQVWDTLPVALDTERHKAWLDEEKYGLPKLPDGRSVETSTYLRVAWIKEGLLLVAEHPLGTGFDRNAFGHGLRMKYGEGMGHSHSGVLDVAIGAGVPGLLLWFAFLVSLAWLGWRRFSRLHVFVGLALLMVVLDYFTRMFLDSTVKDHMLQQFMLVAGLLAALSAAAARPEEHVR